MGVPKEVNDVCRAYGLRVGDVRGYMVTPDYVRVTLADGRRYQVGRLPNLSPYPVSDRPEKGEEKGGRRHG